MTRVSEYRQRLTANLRVNLIGFALALFILPGMATAPNLLAKTRWLIAGCLVAIAGNIDREQAHNERIKQNDYTAIERQVNRQKAYNKLMAEPEVIDIEAEPVYGDTTYDQFNIVEAFQNPLYPHYLLAAPSGSGKTTTLKWLLDLAEKTGSQVTILTPHLMDPDEFGSHKVISNREKIYWAIYELHKEMLRRYEASEEHGWAKASLNFPHLTYAIDEAVSLFGDFKDMDRVLGGNVQKAWVRLLVEARKVGIRLILATQSTRVDCIGLRNRGDIGECLTKLLLGKSAKGRLSYIKRHKNWEPDMIEWLESHDYWGIVQDASGDVPLILPDLS